MAVGIIWGIQIPICPKQCPRGSCTLNFNIGFPFWGIKALTQALWYVHWKKPHFVSATNFCHPFSIVKIRLIIEQKRFCLFNGGRRGNEKHVLLVSPKYSSVRTIWTGDSPKVGKETRKLAGTNSTSQLCIEDSYVSVGHFRIYKSYFHCCLFIQYHPAIVISQPDDFLIYCFTLTCSITYNS